MSKRMLSKFKYKCLICGTEVYSDACIDHCDACGSDEIKKFKSTDITCPDWNNADFIKQTKSSIVSKFLRVAAWILAGLVIASIIAAI